METKTLYNLLRLNALRDAAINAEPWQLFDYRELSLENIFQQLEQHEIFLDRISFMALADEFDSPEELTDSLIADRSIEATTYDQIYLLLFELWRRLVPEKLCPSIFCDELDHQINLYDAGKSNSEQLESLLSNLTVILKDNTEAGNDPKEVFEQIKGRCANDVETFLYDFITDQIENKNVPYASELVEDFGPFVKDSKWFALLRARILSFTDNPQANQQIRQLMQRLAAQPDPEFNMEVLFLFVQGFEQSLFRTLVKQTLPLLQTEEEFQDLLSICSDYFHFSDNDQKEMALLKILKERSQVPLDNPIQLTHPHYTTFKKVV